MSQLGRQRSQGTAGDNTIDGSVSAQAHSNQNIQSSGYTTIGIQMQLQGRLKICPGHQETGSKPYRPATGRGASAYNRV